MPRCIPAVAILLLVSCASAAMVPVGAAAPPITLDQLIPARPAAEATLAALSGKVIVLEFWATWCAPCIEQIPHINDLIEQFKDRPVQFLSITDEEPALIEAFLKKRPIAGWVGIDRKNQSYKAYGYEGIPQTVLIDRTGRVAAITHPMALKAGHIEDALAGRPVALQLPQMHRQPEISRAADGGPAPLVDVLIRPAADKSGSSASSSRTKYTAHSTTLRHLIAAAFEFLPDRIEGEPVSAEDRYDIAVSFPAANRGDLQALVRQVVCTTFRVKVSRQTRDTEVVVLKAPDGKPPRLAETASTGGSSSSMGRGQLRFTGCTLSSLANSVAGALHRNVIDETGLAGRYDIALKYDESAPDSLLRAIRDTLGLAIEPATRPVEFLVITRDEN